MKLLKVLKNRLSKRVRILIGIILVILIVLFGLFAYINLRQHRIILVHRLRQAVFRQMIQKAQVILDV